MDHRITAYDGSLWDKRAESAEFFFKSENTEALRAWYAKYLGIISEGDRGSLFRWDQADSPAKENFTAWCIFPASTKYFGAGKASFMINYVVDDLHGILKHLRDEGVWVD